MKRLSSMIIQFSEGRRSEKCGATRVNTLLLSLIHILSFRVKKGELFAFLGVNGAGKSTTISILCGLQKKDSGMVQVNGCLLYTSMIPSSSMSFRIVELIEFTSDRI